MVLLTYHLDFWEASEYDPPFLPLKRFLRFTFVIRTLRARLMETESIVEMR
jgi:hypothetical protein